MSEDEVKDFYRRMARYDRLTSGIPNLNPNEVYQMEKDSEALDLLRAKYPEQTDELTANYMKAIHGRIIR